MGTKPHISEAAEGIPINKDSLLHNLFREKCQSFLGAAGISVVITVGGYHRQVGREETAVFEVKKVIVRTLRGVFFNSTFNYFHKMCLIQVWVNNRPSILSNHKIITPVDFEAAMLQH